MRAEFAMFGMIDGHERVDAGVAGGFKFVPRQLALEFRQHTEIDALQAEGGLFQIDDRDAGNGAEDFRRRFHHPSDAGMTMQSDAHRNSPVQMRRELSEPLPEETHERRHLERARAALTFERG